MRTKHLFVLIHIRIKGEVGIVKQVKASGISLLTVPRRCFLGDHFCYLFFMFVFDMLSSLLLAALWSPVGKGLTSWLFYVLCFLVLLSLSHMVSRVRCCT